MDIEKEPQANGPQNQFLLIAYPVLEMGGTGLPYPVALVNPRHSPSMQEFAVIIGNMNLAMISGQTTDAPTVMWLDPN